MTTDNLSSLYKYIIFQNVYLVYTKLCVCQSCQGHLFGGLEDILASSIHVDGQHPE